MRFTIAARSCERVLLLSQPDRSYRQREPSTFAANSINLGPPAIAQPKGSDGVPPRPVGRSSVVVETPREAATVQGGLVADLDAVVIPGSPEGGRDDPPIQSHDEVGGHRPAAGWVGQDEADFHGPSLCSQGTQLAI